MCVYYTFYTYLYNKKINENIDLVFTWSQRNDLFEEKSQHCVKIHSDRKLTFKGWGGSQVDNVLVLRE